MNSTNERSRVGAQAFEAHPENEATEPLAVVFPRLADSNANVAARAAVQRRARGGDGGGGRGIAQTAAMGVAGSGSPLPYLDQIQASFGRHDVTGISAHVGGAASQASEAIGAEAYATGSSVAFRSTPDLHTAAHEAAHVVQQQGGVQLKAGVGREGDEYERHADAVADQVVQGKSAEGLLDRYAGTGTKGSTGAQPAVQRKRGGELARLTPSQLFQGLKRLNYPVRFSEMKTVLERLDQAPRDIVSVEDAVSFLAETPAPEVTTAPPKQVEETRTAPKPVVKQPAPQTTSEPTKSVEELNRAKGKTMARMEYPTWELVEPLLAGYGVTEESDKLKIKEVIERTAVNENVLIRGIPDLIARAGIGINVEAVADHVKQVNTAAAPDLSNVTTEPVVVGRDDTRPPHVVKDSGGLFGWNNGIVTVEHARRLIAKVQVMSPSAQKSWISAWKWPTPDSVEQNPWVATGIGSGQKSGTSYTCSLPLIFATEGGGMNIGTDTGDISSANVIGVRLGTSAEIVVLTGIPWKYVTSINGIDKETAAAQSRPLDKSTKSTTKAGPSQTTAPQETTAPQDTTAPTLAKSSGGSKLTVLDLPEINVPTDGVPVFQTAPEYIRVSVDGHVYRVLAGQNFLNTELSNNYKDDAEAIKGSAVSLRKPMGSGYDDDVLVLGDGHHRFVWASFLGADIECQDISTRMRAPGQPWANLTYATKGKALVVPRRTKNDAYPTLTRPTPKNAPDSDDSTTTPVVTPSVVDQLLQPEEDTGAPPTDLPGVTDAAQKELLVARKGAETRSFKYLGGGANKQAFKAKAADWVVLATAKGASFLEKERDELATLASSGIDVPAVGDSVFDVSLNGGAGSAFIEQFVQGTEARRSGATATFDHDIDAFLNQILAKLGAEASFDIAHAKVQKAIDSLEKLEAYFAAGKTIPDFQPMFNESTGEIITIDPGDRSSEGNHLDRYKSWIDKLLRTLRPMRKERESNRVLSSERRRLSLPKWT